jgi:hypothetical protein
MSHSHIASLTDSEQFNRELNGALFALCKEEVQMIKFGRVCSERTMDDHQHNK